MVYTEESTARANRYFSLDLSSDTGSIRLFTSLGTEQRKTTQFLYAVSTNGSTVTMSLMSTPAKVMVKQASMTRR